MTKTFRLCALMLSFLAIGKASAQQRDTVDYYKGISRQNIRKLWMMDSLSNSDCGKVPIPGILGFTGDNYQRFFIHFTSSAKNDANPYSYLVAGKTMSSKDICSFVGEIKVMQAFLYVNNNDTKAPTGIVVSACTLHEQCGNNKSTITGTLRSFFCIKKGHAVYDDLMSGADGYCNNQFTGTRRLPDGTGVKCNWGEYRIPGAGALDNGAGEFVPADNYLDNGWRSYKEMFTGDSTTQAKATLWEHRLWWK